MTLKHCNRCNRRHSTTSRNNGTLELKFGHVRIEANLCESCYEEMVEAYEDVDNG